MRAWLFAMLVACGGGEGGPPGDLTAPVGRRCDPGGVPMDETLIATPSLDCQSRLCLHRAGEDLGLCTDECTDAAQCNEDAASTCEAGFVCAPVVSTGPFGCHSICVCADNVPATTCP